MSLDDVLNRLEQLEERVGKIERSLKLDRELWRKFLRSIEILQDVAGR